MLIEHVMKRQVVTVTPDDTLEHVRSLFDKHGFHHLIVVEKSKVVGVLSDRDLLRNLSPFIGKASERAQDAFLLRRHVHQIMTRKLVSVRPFTPIKDAVIMMLANTISCVPVLDDHGGCAGIVAERDLLRYLLECGIEPTCAINRTAA